MCGEGKAKLESGGGSRGNLEQLTRPEDEDCPCCGGVCGDYSTLKKGLQMTDDVIDRDGDCDGTIQGGVEGSKAIEDHFFLQQISSLT